MPIHGKKIRAKSSPRTNTPQDPTMALWKYIGPMLASCGTVRTESSASLSTYSITLLTVCQELFEKKLNMPNTFSVMEGTYIAEPKPSGAMYILQRAINGTYRKAVFINIKRDEIFSSLLHYNLLGKV